MDIALVDQALSVMEDFVASFDPDCYSGEEAAQIFDMFAELEELVTAKILVATAWARTGETEFSERLLRWLVCEKR